VQAAKQARRAFMKVLVITGVGHGGYIGQMYHPETKRMLDTSGYPFGEPVHIGRLRAVIGDDNSRYGLVLSVQGIETEREWGIYAVKPHVSLCLDEREVWLLPEAIIVQLPELDYGKGFWDDPARIHL
jgi:hypothetical protein